MKLSVLKKSNWLTNFYTIAAKTIEKPIKIGVRSKPQVQKQKSLLFGRLLSYRWYWLNCFLIHYCHHRFIIASHIYA